jgi:hypothetical protein
VVRVVAVISMGSRHLVLHPVVLGAHRDGLCIHAVADVLHPPLRGRHGVVMVLLPDLSRLAVAARLCDHLLDIFQDDVHGIVADVEDVVLPVQVDIGDVCLLSQGPLHGTGTTQAVHATEFERALPHGNMLLIGCCRSPRVVVGHGGYVLLNMLHILSLPMAEGDAAVAP